MPISLGQRDAGMKGIAQPMGETDSILNAIFAHCPDGIVVADDDGNILEANRAVSGFFGIGRDRLIGRNLAEFIVSDRDIALGWKPLVAASAVYGDRKLKNASGQLVDVLISGSAHFQPNRGLYFFRDISARKDLESDLQLEKAFASHILETSPLLIVGILPDGTTTFVNQAVQERTGYSRGEIIGKNWWTTLYPGDEYAQVTQLFAAFEKGAVKDYQMALTTKAGAKRVVSWNSVNRFSRSGELVEVVGVGMDVTDLLNAAAALKVAKEEAERAYQTKSDFLANMSHELRTPLTLILGPLEELLSAENVPRDRLETELRTIQRNGLRLLGLVNDVLDLTKVESKKMEVSWQHADLEKIVSELVCDTAPLMRARKIEPKFRATGKVRPVYIDTQLLEKIVLNLFSNAIKFTPEGGKIEVTLEFRDADFRLSVRDSGIGIPADKVHQLFRRFQQVDASVKRKFGGTGIGLALVKEFAELMEGSVEVESTLGVGSCFRVVLPTKDRAIVKAVGEPVAGGKSAGRKVQLRALESAAAVATGPGSDSKADVSGKKSLRILVVDDEVDLRRFIVRSLGQGLDGTPIVVHEAGNGKEALAAMDAFQPNIVLSDVMMPEMSGSELVAQLKSNSRYRHIPVIMLTAKASREDIIHGLETGADDYLPKPFGPAELRARALAAYRLYSTHQVLQSERIEREAAQKADQAKSLFLANVSHELRTPMHGILSFARFGQQKIGTASREKIKSYFDEIYDSGSRLMVLLNDLLDLAKLEAGKVEYSMREGDLAEIAKAAEREMSAFAGEKRLKLEVTSCEARGTFDTDKILQVLRNLVSNAIKFSDADTKVRIRVDVANAKLRCQVENQGLGIPATELGMIFDKFVQSSKTRTGAGGTGLGLAICKEIVEQHGGKIWAENVAGGKTVFTFELPANQGANERRAA